jgi:hypothetical protein
MTPEEIQSLKDRIAARKALGMSAEEYNQRTGRSAKPESPRMKAYRLAQEVADARAEQRLMSGFKKSCAMLAQLCHETGDNEGIEIARDLIRIARGWFVWPKPPRRMRNVWIPA